MLSSEYNLGWNWISFWNEIRNLTALTTSALDNRDSTVALMLYANFQAASHTNLAPNLPPPKPDLRLTDPSVELSKSSEQSLTSFSVFEI